MSFIIFFLSSETPGEEIQTFQEKYDEVEPPEKTLSSTPDSGLGEDVKEESKFVETEAKFYQEQAEENHHPEDSEEHNTEEKSTDPQNSELAETKAKFYQEQAEQNHHPEDSEERNTEEKPTDPQNSKLAETEAKFYQEQAEENHHPQDAEDHKTEEKPTDPLNVEAPVTNPTEVIPGSCSTEGSTDIAEETPDSSDQIDNSGAVNLETDLASSIEGPSTVMTSQSQSKVKINTPEPQSREITMEKEGEKPIRRTPHPLSRVNTLKKQESGDVTMLSLKPNYDSSHDDLDITDEEEELQKLSWDSDNDERIDLGLEDGTSCKVEAWDTNSDNGKYLTGIEAQRVIVEGMRKKVETMKTLLTPGYSNQGSVFNFPSASVGMRKSLSSSGDCDEVFQGK